MKPIFSIPAEQLRALLEQVISSAPEFPYEGSVSLEDERWLARAETLIEAGNSISDTVAFRLARSNLKTYSHSRSGLIAPLLNTLERVELYSPAVGQGRFIPPGETWKGYAALVKILQPACGDLLIVDPYLDASVFVDLLPHTNASEGVRCLTTKGQYHGGLVAAYQKWQADPIGTAHPAELRFAAPKSLHDRMIIVDLKDVWLVSQSLKDIGVHSPASLTRAEPELSSLKCAHYDELWQQAVVA